MPVLDELHVPPVVPELNVELLPTQSKVTPVIVAGSGFTVTTWMLLQPYAMAYVTIVVPADTPVTTPLLFTVAFSVSLLLHVPPAVLLARVLVDPAHRTAVPVIPAGTGLTVSVTVLMHPFIAV